MANKAQLEKLQNELLKKGVAGYETLENIFLEVFKSNFGTDNDLYKDAEGIKSGWNVPGRFGYINGAVPAEEYKQCKYNEYVRLISEALNYLTYVESEVNMGVTTTSSNKVFIVHGHDSKTKYEVAYYLQTIGLTPIILHEQANGGIKSIIGKLQENADVTCAIILLTADDIGKAKDDMSDPKPRARQNVVFEAGYFIGKLGEDRVVMIADEDIEGIGDLSGCIYIPNDQNGGWREKLKKEFKLMGINYTE